MPRKIRVDIPFDALPGSCYVTGRVLKEDGYKFERHGINPAAYVKFKTVLSFKEEALSSVRNKLRGKRYSEVKITSIRFA
ncbi:MAG: hypothetical protein HYW90_04460 [Candidatus Sungbacteria bacterium]|nr:hypothetical protein [Candidatus Sungbacteria bacterium]